MSPSCMISKRLFALAGTFVLVSTSGCDSSEPDECLRIEEQSYTASAPATESISLDKIATFELQQDVWTYEAAGCVIPDDGSSETSLVIRNVTSCEVSFTYRLSVFEGREGSSVEGTTFVRQAAANDEGVVLRNQGYRLDRAQILVTIWDVTQESCG